MKKALSIAIILLFVTSILSASFSLGPHPSYFNSFSSELLSSRNSLGVFNEKESSMKGQFIRFDKRNGEAGEWYLPINSYDKSKDSFFLHLQTGGSLSALNMGFDGIAEFQFVMDAHISSVFFLMRGSDLLGFDGVYFLGGEGKILDRIIFRGGIRHFSGHVGDEVLTSALRNDPSFIHSDMTEFVEDAYEFTLGYSDLSFPYLKGAFGVIVSKKESYLMPFVHRPDWIISGGKTNAERDPLSYAIRGDYGKDYNDLTLYSEIKSTIPFSWGRISLSYILTLYESGKTKHTLDPSDDDGRWDVDQELRLSFALENNNLSLGFNTFIKKGRFPLLNMYWRQSTSLGFSFTLKG